MGFVHFESVAKAYSLTISAENQPKRDGFGRTFPLPLNSEFNRLHSLSARAWISKEESEICRFEKNGFCAALVEADVRHESR